MPARLIVPVALGLATAAWGQCTPEWLPGPGLPGLDGTVYATTSWDPDGAGPQPPVLVVGGSFTIAGTALAANIAQWDGTSWSPLGTGIGAYPYSPVFALTVFDDGSGPALYAGGYFVTARGAKANGIARWDGTSWSPLGTGMNGWPSALTVFDDGSGPALYAGGYFTTAGGAAANYIARWDGTSWSPLGTGMSGGYTLVSALTVFDDGGGPALYAGGEFWTAGGAAASHIARWDGTSWSPLGTGMSGSGSYTSVSALTVFDDGSGPALYAGGRFTTSGGTAANYIARWDGTSWSPLGTGMSGGYTSVSALTVFDDGSGPALYAGGVFAMAGGAAASRIAKWEGTSWSPLGTWTGKSHAVLALTVFDDGSGPALYAGGAFTTTGGAAANHIARWDGTSWSPLGTGMSGSGPYTSVSALTVFDDGSGPALYAGGIFTTAGGAAANSIAKWDGTSWSPLGTGMNGGVLALTVFDDGSGPALYAGGGFTTAGGAAANSIARWDGTSWSPLGTGMAGSPIFGSASVSALTVFDDGSGPALYAGGFFSAAGGTAANFIAKWDGTRWSPLGTGMWGSVGFYSAPSVSALTVFDDGSGPALYAGGIFTTAGGIAANGIARWDGTSWSPLGTGLSGWVHALTVFDNGGGPALYAGGYFVTAGGAAANHIARWDGTSWSPLGTGMNYRVSALTVFDDGSGPALHAGGSFTTAGGGVSAHWARWGCACYPDCNSSGTLSVSDFSCFQSQFVAGSPYADCNQSGTLTVADFGCFQTRFVAGCP